MSGADEMKPHKAVPRADERQAGAEEGSGFVILTFVGSFIAVLGVLTLSESAILSENAMSIILILVGFVLMLFGFAKVLQIFGKEKV